ncbi:hypothetical protein [Streptomyces canarius]
MTGPIHLYDRYDEPDQLRDQLRRLLCHRVVIALGIVLGLLGGAALALSRAHTYTSTSDVLVRSTADPFGTVSVAADNQVSMGTEQQIAASTAVAVRAARLMGQADGKAAALEDALRITNQAKSQVLRFEFTARTPKRAARGANAFAEAYLADRKARNQAAVQRATRGVEQQIKTVEAAQKKVTEDDDATKALRSQLDTLRKRVVDINSRDTDGGDVVRRGEAPTRPSAPGWPTLLALGLASGLALGILLAWPRSALDTRVRFADQAAGRAGAPRRSACCPPGTARTTTCRRSAARAVTGPRPCAPSPTGCAGPPCPPAPAGCSSLPPARCRHRGGRREPGRGPRGVRRRGAAGGRRPRHGRPHGPAAAAAGRHPHARGRLLAARREPPRRRRDRRAVRLLRRRRHRFARPDGRVRRRPPAAGRSDSRTTVVVTRPLLEHADALALAQRVDGVLLVAGLGSTRRDDLRRAHELIDCSGGTLLGIVLDAGRRGRLRAVLGRRPARRPEAETVPPVVATPGAGRHALGLPRSPPGATAATPAAANSVAAAARGGWWGVAGSATNAVFAFVFVGLITRALGAQGAGAVFTGVALFTILGNTCKLGADSGLVRLVSRDIAVGGGRSVGGLLRAAVVPAAVASTAAALPLLLCPGVATTLLPHLPPADALPLVRPSGGPARRHRPTGPARRHQAMAPRRLRRRGAGRQAGAARADRRTGGRLGAGSVPLAAAWLLPVLAGTLAAWPALRRCRAVRAHRAAGRARGRSWRAFWTFAAPRAISSVFDISAVWVGVLLLSALATGAEAGVYTAIGRVVTAGTLLQLAVRLAGHPRSADCSPSTRSPRRATCTGSRPAQSCSSPGRCSSSSPPSPGPCCRSRPEFVRAAPALLALCLASMVNVAVGNAQTVLLMSGRSSWHLAVTAAAFMVQSTRSACSPDTRRGSCSRAAGVLGAAIVVENPRPPC